MNFDKDVSFNYTCILTKYTYNHTSNFPYIITIRLGKKKTIRLGVHFLEKAKILD